MESEPLLPNPPLPPSIPLLPLVHPLPPPPGPQPTPPTATGGGGGGNGGGFPQQQGGSPLSSRKEILCRHYMLQGFCPFGEKCWFAHPEPNSVTGPSPLRGGAEGGPPSGGGAGGGGLPHHPPGGIGHIQLPPNFWLNNPTAMADIAALTGSPPQSPLNPALVPRSPLMFRPRGGGGGGAGGVAFSAGQQPLFLLRNPLAGNPRMPASNLPLIQPAPIPPQINPILKFTLLSQVVLQGFKEGEGGEGGGEPGEDIITDISQLATFADHFFVSYGSNINTYRIIFGGNRNYQVSSIDGVGGA